MWLLATRPSRIKDRRSLAALETQGRYAQWLEKLPEKVNARTGHLDKHRDGSPVAKAAAVYSGHDNLFSLTSLPPVLPSRLTALAVVSCCCCGAWRCWCRIPGRFSALMLIVLSLTVSCRYIWWRYLDAQLG